MPIFDEIYRTDGYPKSRNESLFAYLNRSTDPDVAKKRRIIEKWYESYLEDGQMDIKGRFRSKRDDALQSAFFELELYQLLSGLGCTAKVHPEIEGLSTHPDFLVNYKDQSFYLEAKVVDPESRAFRLNRNEQNVIDKLNSLPSDGFRIGVDMEGKLSSTLSRQKVTGPFIKLLEDNDPDKVQRIIDQGRMYDAPFETLRCGDWVLTGWLCPIPPDDRNGSSVRPVVIHPYKAMFLGVRTSVMDALKEKAGKYGKPSSPLVVAISSMDPFFHEGYPELDVLFGEEVYFPETRRRGRKANGFWHESASLQVSAVWFFHRVDVLNLFGLPDKASACLYINPSLEAVRLPKALYHLTYATSSVSEGMRRVNRVQGENVGSVLGL